MPYYYYGFDPTYVLVLIGAVICLIASARVKSTFNKYSQYRSMSGMTGAQAAERILNSAGIYDVTVCHISGSLTDHYNPSKKTLNLSDSVYGSNSVAAIGVAAHECGHAIQHQKNYVPLTLRTAIVPVANIGSTLAWPLILIGLFFNRSTGAMLINLGILCFSFAVLFQLVTLPVEFNASRRALHILGEQGILSDSELPYTRKVLKAAALTYVAKCCGSNLTAVKAGSFYLEDVIVMTDTVNTRRLALDVLLEVTEHGAYSNQVLRAVLEKYQYMEKYERAFLTRLVEGTIQHMIELDYVIDQFSKVKVKKMKPVIRNILRMGVYQIQYMDSVPDSAACNEAVKLARKSGFSTLSGFVNGVLRNIARTVVPSGIRMKKKEPVLALSVRYSMPEWIVEEWLNAYGMEQTKAI